MMACFQSTLPALSALGDKTTGILPWIGLRVDLNSKDRGEAARIESEFSRALERDFAPDLGWI